ERPMIREMAVEGPRAVDVLRLTGRQKVMRTRHDHHLRGPCPLIGFPDEGVACLDAPFARRLLLGDVEVKMRPAPAAPFLPQHADLPAHRHLDAGPDPVLDELEMA